MHVFALYNQYQRSVYFEEIHTAPQHKWLPTAPGVCSGFVWMGKCRARIPSMGHRTWLYVMSLSLFKRGQYDFFFLGNLYIFFIQQGCIILTKSDWIYLCCCKSAVNFKWFIPQRILKKSIIILNRTTVFNTDYNKKCVLSIKLAYQNDFWRIMWHWWL